MGHAAAVLSDARSSAVAVRLIMGSGSTDGKRSQALNLPAAQPIHRAIPSATFKSQQIVAHFQLLSERRAP
jgi:hypothetical protein